MLSLLIACVPVAVDAARWAIDSPVLRRIAEEARPFLEKGDTVGSVVKVRAGLWAVIAGRCDENDCLSNANLSLFLSHGTRLELLGKQVLVKDQETNGVFEILASMSSMTGRGRRELAITLVELSGSYYPEDQFVFRATSKGLTKLGQASAEEGSEMRDLNHDGKVELLVTNDIDTGVSHSEMPKWTDVYEFRAGRYHWATTRFPSVIRQQASYIDKMIKRRPEARQLWIYRGMAQAAFHHPNTARRDLLRGLRWLGKQHSKYARVDAWNQQLIGHGQSALNDLD